jgi:hypothetical protein
MCGVWGGILHNMSSQQGLGLGLWCLTPLSTILQLYHPLVMSCDILGFGDFSFTFLWLIIQSYVIHRE